MLLGCHRGGSIEIHRVLSGSMRGYWDTVVCHRGPGVLLGPIVCNWGATGVLLGVLEATGVPQCATGMQ